MDRVAGPSLDRSGSRLLPRSHDNVIERSIASRSDRVAPHRNWARAQAIVVDKLKACLTRATGMKVDLLDD